MRTPETSFVPLTVALAVALLVALPAVAEHPTAEEHHPADHQCPHGGGDHHEMDHHGMDHHSMDHSSSALPTLPGQDAFGALQEIVALLEADPSTDWSRVDVDALRDHLVDMQRLTIEAEVESRAIEGGVEHRVRGEGKVLESIRRMVPAHSAMMNGHGGVSTEVETLDDGVRLTLRSDDPSVVERLRALGFFGFMVRGDHHRPHHLAIALGGSPHHQH